MLDCLRFAVRAVGLGLALASVAGPPASAGPVPTPHRAVYDIALAESSGSGSVAQARGKLEFEWADACTGWTITQRTRVEMVSTEGQVIDFGWTLSAFEAKDGEHYRFFIRRLSAGRPGEEVRGEARLSGPGRGGLASYSEPEGREVILPKGTLFPTAHSLLLIEAAERGELPLWRMVFDGSGEEGLFGVNAVLSQALSADAELGFESPLLRGRKSWRLQLAYFGTDETEAAPEHEQALRLFANGVVDELVLDYGDFALRANLESLEALPPPGC